MRTYLFLILPLAACLLGACSGRSNQPAKQPTYQVTVKNDQTIYGYACDGCTDSTLVLLPSSMDDPVKYNIIEATRAQKVLGQIKVGDFMAVVLNPEDGKVADLVVDIDQLQGIWCYIVMPKMRDYEQMSNRAQAKMMMAMPDSIKETYLIPREYGFALKRQWNAASVGYVPQKSSLEDESPVVYPPLLYYKEWHIWNGKLLMVSGIPTLQKDNTYGIKDIRLDTCDIVYLKDDSLILSSDGITRGYYRKTNINDINKKARNMAKKLQKEALEKSKNR